MNKSLVFSGLKPECQELTEHLIKAYGMLSYGEARAVQGYSGDAKNAAVSAISHLDQAGLDKEDISDILQPLKEIISSVEIRGRGAIEKLHPHQIQSRLHEAQEEILAVAAIFIAGCQHGIKPSESLPSFPLKKKER